MSAQLVILGLLSEKPRHGYELHQEVERRLYATYINLSGGSLYYNLGRLERAGYVEKTRVEQNGRYPARRIYQITPAGTAHFRAELRKLLFDAEGREKVFDPFNTALAFGHFVDEEELREAVITHLKWAQERAVWIRTQQKHWQSQEISFAQGKIIEHGLAHCEAEIHWLRRFLRDLDGRETTALKQESQANVS